jgi:hypothetical protein
MAVGLAICTYFLGQQAGQNRGEDRMSSAINGAFSQCQTQGSWLLCPSHIRAIAATE